MRLTYKKFKYNLKLIWFFSYITVLILPLTACIIVYFHSANALKVQIENQNTRILENIRDNIDTQLVLNEKMALELVVDKKINEIASYTLPLTKEERFNLYSFISQDSAFLNYMSANIGQFSICFSDIDVILTNQAGYTLKNYYEIFLKGSNLDIEEWGKFISGKYSGEYINLSKKDSADYIAYVKTLPLKLNNSNTVNVFYLLDADRIVDNVDQLYAQKDGYFKIVAQDGSIIVEKGSKTGNDKALIIRCVSEINNWEYYYSIPNNKAFSSLVLFKNIIILLLGFCFLFGIYLIFIFTKRNYKPISSLVKLFDNNDVTYNTQNEYSYLNDMILMLFSEKNEAEKQKENKERYAISLIIDKVIIGESVCNEYEISELYKLQLGSSDFYVINLYPINVENIFFQQDNGEDDRNIAYYIIANIMDEFLCEMNIKKISTANSNGIVYIVALSENEEEIFWEKISFLQKFVSDNFNFDVCCAISSKKSEIKGIEDGYKEVLQIMSYLSVHREKGLWRFSDFTEGEKKYSYSFENEQQLVMFIKSSDKEKVRAMLENLFKRNTEEKPCSIDVMRTFVLSLCTTAIRTLYQCGKNVDDTLNSDLKFLRNIFNYSNLDMIKEITYRIFDVACEKMVQSSEKEALLVQNVIKYVSENYADINMNIASIARTFSIQYDQLSKIFKEQTGKRLLDFLNNVRVDHAKTILRTTDVMITDIPALAGFSNYRTFVRVFTAIVGVGPKKYRDTVGEYLDN